MTFQELINELNVRLKGLGNKVQKYSKDYWNKSRIGKQVLFGEVKNESGGEYSLHVGGRKEMQFNVGIEKK